MKFRIHAVVFFAAAGLFVSCKKSAPVEAPPVPVTVTPIIQNDVIVSNQWVGLLDGFQNSNIQAQVTGYLLTQNYKEGSAVKKGDILFTIDPRPFQAAFAQAEADYASSVAKAQLQQLTLQKQTQLYQTKVISEQEYQTSYQNTQASLANVAASQASMQAAQVNLDYCTIRAPFDGVAGLAQAQIGDLVGPGGQVSSLTQASQIEPMKMNFFITEAEYLGAAELLQRIQNQPEEEKKARFSLQLANGSSYPELGKFDFFNRQVNVSTGAIQITVIFPNPNGVLRPGLFAKITAPVQEIKGALLVPQKATVEMQGNYFVSVLQPDDTVKPVFVKLGPPQGQFRVVSGSLQAGEKVVVEGIEKARPGMKVSASAYQMPTASATGSAKPSTSPAPETTK